VDRDVALMVELLSFQERQGPGSEATTRRALEAVGPLAASAGILDLGCGRGSSAVILARHTTGHVLAVDALAPMVEATRDTARARGLDDRVTAVVGDMLAPPVSPGTADLIWCETAVYAVGLQQALRAWREALRPGGVVAVSDAVMRTTAPSVEALGFWASEGIHLGTAAQMDAAVQACGYDLIEAFGYPDEDWDTYYAGFPEAVAAFRARHPDDPVAEAIAGNMLVEAETWAHCRGEYGYRFVIARVR